MPNPGTVYLTNGEEIEAHHVDSNDGYVHVQVVVDGEVYAKQFPWRKVDSTKVHIGSYDDCDNLKEVDPGAH